jgi:hypothetical protein
MIVMDHADVTMMPCGSLGAETDIVGRITVQNIARIRVRVRRTQAR